jgi:hypothetical protein
VIGNQKNQIITTAEALKIVFGPEIMKTYFPQAILQKEDGTFAFPKGQIRGSRDNLIKAFGGELALRDKFFKFAEEGRPLGLRLAVAAGMDIDARDETRATALMLAVRMGHKNCVAFLISRGAAVNMQYDEGWDALMLAAENGRPECVQLLLDAGADRHALNPFGRTAESLAKNMAERDWPITSRDRIKQAHYKLCVKIFQETPSFSRKAFLNINSNAVYAPN